MPSCQRCWRDASYIAISRCTEKVEEYHRLIEERDCTPEQQAGEEARKCPRCERMAIHEICGICMACDYEEKKP